MSPAPTFSLIIATYGRAAVLEALVQSLVKQSNQSFEVIVADQNSDDDVAPLLEPLRQAGRLAAHLRLPAPNLSAARNAGIAAANGVFVAFPDDDCWYDPDTLARAEARLVATPPLDGIAARWAEAPAEPGDNLQGPITPAAIRKFRAGNLASITLMVKREAVLAIGGFDERIGVGRWYGSGEETDLMLALVAGGCRIAHASDVVVHHAFDTSRRHEGRWDVVRSRARGTGALYAKHHLPGWVIARGLLAPLLPRDGMTLKTGAALSLGRLEGLIGWSLHERRSRSVATAVAGRTAATSETKTGGAA
ncbi:MAG: glycosyltransferase family A protein [Hyphomicrobiaceae bacterium]